MVSHCVAPEMPGNSGRVGSKAPEMPGNSGKVGSKAPEMPGNSGVQGLGRGSGAARRPRVVPFVRLRVACRPRVGACRVSPKRASRACRADVSHRTPRVANRVSKPRVTRAGRARRVSETTKIMAHGAAASLTTGRLMARDQPLDSSAPAARTTLTSGWFMAGRAKGTWSVPVSWGTPTRRRVPAERTSRLTAPRGRPSKSACLRLGDIKK